MPCKLIWFNKDYLRLWKESCWKYLNKNSHLHRSIEVYIISKESRKQVSDTADQNVYQFKKYCSSNNTEPADALTPHLGWMKNDGLQLWGPIPLVTTTTACLITATAYKWLSKLDQPSQPSKDKMSYAVSGRVARLSRRHWLKHFPTFPRGQKS